MSRLPLIAVLFSLAFSLGACNATETGFDCAPTCGALLCGNPDQPLYGVEISILSETEVMATLVDHIGGAVLEVESVTFPRNASYIDGARGLMLLQPMVAPEIAVAAYFPIETDGGDSITCEWTTLEAGATMSVSQITAYNTMLLDSCIDTINAQAPPMPCDG